MFWGWCGSNWVNTHHNGDHLGHQCVSYLDSRSLAEILYFLCAHGGQEQLSEHPQLSHELSCKTDGGSALALLCWQLECGTPSMLGKLSASQGRDLYGTRCGCGNVIFGQAPMKTAKASLLELKTLLWECSYHQNKQGAEVCKEIAAAHEIANKSCQAAKGKA